jgi:hypothetical protein
MLLTVPNVGAGWRQLPMLHSNGGGVRLPAYLRHCDSRFCLCQPKLKEAANYGGLKSRGNALGGAFVPKEMGVTAPATSMPISIVAQACRGRNADPPCGARKCYPRQRRGRRSDELQRKYFGRSAWPATMLALSSRARTLLIWRCRGAFRVVDDR